MHVPTPDNASLLRAYRHALATITFVTRGEIDDARELVGAENPVASRDLHVLMYEAAESVSSERLDGCFSSRGSGACGRVLL